ncbi:GNAT family N-acetyltransferase [Herbiconiux sp. CPCC 205763]|uniref:GNAT family N-acetyltransferase n=1 Tax=Herbiconiux aconitum TaxID=2970913 RepID=A0ABT2GMS0_9MICO|nr:GNAT family N-acetyltransferase [Herbiconiux aconitum]MCS5716882.1 GNAT family N-acetyltransferase [Herbiconiux aconitum]
MVTRVRTARLEDAGIVSAVAAETFEMACPPSTAPAAIAAFIAENLSDARFAGYLSDPERSVILADVDGEIAGYTMLIGGEPTDQAVAAAVAGRPTVELSKCYVRENFHGFGVASALMTASIEGAERSGAASVWLGVNQQNARAIRFYEKSGFRKVGVKQFLVGDELHDDFVFERALALPAPSSE